MGVKACTHMYCWLYTYDLEGPYNNADSVLSRVETKSTKAK